MTPGLESKMEVASERRSGDMVLRRRSTIPSERYCVDDGIVLDEFLFTNLTPVEKEGAGCAWRGRKGRKGNGIYVPPQKWPKKKISARFDVTFSSRLNGKIVRHGLHPFGRSKSTRGLSSRALRRGVQVQARSRFTASFLQARIYQELSMEWSTLLRR